MIKQTLYPIIALLLFTLSIWYVFYDLSPQYNTDFNAHAKEFSVDRAFIHVEKIASKPHYLGTKAHSYARNYIIEQLEELGLKVHTQENYSLNKNGVFTIPQNIVAKIEGKNPDAKSLLLLSHYDSNPHSSFGASDAASGVAAILEALRAYLSAGVLPQHDIIICFTDAEEVGLVGANLFVDNHPWAKNVGLVLNFEARGSGGPSNMIIETNHGNAKMIRAFAESNIENPLANSLMYSVYKMLPNDTDSTVFREKADIPSYFFAFIDDHYDYHTALDIPERLDKKALAHQGDYALNLLNHFSKTSIDDKLKSASEMVYFNLPEFGVFYYPFEWIWYMYAACSLLFLFILYRGVKLKVINRSEIFKGFIPFLLSLAVAFVLGYFGWQLIKLIYPHYEDILQGFPYNGHNYIFAFVSLSIAFALSIYNRFQKHINPHNAMVFPLVFWFIICGLINLYLPGAAFFSIALGFVLIAFANSTFTQVPNLFFNWLMSIPTIGLVIPLIYFFPVGLGMNMVVISTILSILVFCLLYGFIGYLPFKRGLSTILLFIGIAFLIVAHFNSDFSNSRPKPNSLVYLQDFSQHKAYWATYDRTLDGWNSSFFKDTVSIENNVLQSKYKTAFTNQSQAQYVNFPVSDFEIKIDTLKNNLAKVKLTISPNANTKRFEIFTDKTYNFKSFTVNRQVADSIVSKNEKYHVFQKRFQSRLLVYHVINQEKLNLEFTGELPLPDFELFETRFDLLNNDKLDVPKRKPDMIPKPFVVNDAIIIKRRIHFNEAE